MPLPSFLQRKDKSAPQRRAAPAAAAGNADEGGPVQEARIRARRRLIGAAVLLLVGVVGFPLLFETEPRPVAVDIPIETARKGSGGVVQSLPVTPPADEPRPVAASPAPAATSSSVTEAPQEAVEPAPAAPKAVPPVQAAPEARPAAPAARPPASAAAPKPATTDAQRARALLDDKPAAPAAPATPAVPPPAAASKDSRYVVQVGAYTDSAALREARQKVEKLGLKTYTQVIETDAGKRTRVRIGPFATREEADRAGARLKAAGLPAAILTL
ncbi:SPOR domain-containing protein [Rubrivivax sp. RP6-9]|uniref:SPOR domain-containing protein n=1 Tax=Rubrivivax sp. RP6-9 TaxID=3415750 RepID=UPI003CC56D2E